MVKSQHKIDVSKGDIAEQSYQGPSVFSAAAGEGFIAHFKWALIALTTVGTAAFVFHGTTNKILNGIRNHSKKYLIKNPTGSSEYLQNGWGTFWLGVFGHGHDKEVANAFDALASHGVKESKYLNQQRETGLGLWIYNHTVGLISPFKEAMHDLVEKSPQLRGAFSAAGPFTFIGYFILPIFLSKGGAEKARASRKQFERARDEIWDLRAENGQLAADVEKMRERNAVLNAQLVENENKPTLHISKDQPPVLTDQPIAMTEQAERKDNPADPAFDSPTSITPPRIQEPVIGPAATTGRVLDQAAKGDREWAETLRSQQAAQASEPTRA